MPGWLSSLVWLALGAAAGLGALRSWRQRAAAPAEPAVDPDERLTLRVRSELERRGLWNPTLDVTTVDGVVYLRGRATAAQADAVRAAIERVAGVRAVQDELKRS